VFNEADFAFAPEALWFFQRHQGEHEPLPQRARGWYVFGGYGSARSNSPAGQSSLEAYHLDVAALYFIEPAGRGGYGGYLVSDDSKNWLTGGESKQLIGYPVGGKQGLIPGRLYATSQQPYVLDLVQDGVYSTTGIRSYPGNSGGPLCVLHPGQARYYPAGIYLGESGPNSIIRIIDTNVVELINRADLAANTGENNLGGGISQQEPALAGANPLQAGWLAVTLAPADAVAAGAFWGVAGRSGTLSSGATLALRPGTYAVEFGPAPGFSIPNGVNVTITNGMTTTIQGMYGPETALPRFSSLILRTDGRLEWDLLGEFGANLVIDESADLAAWTPIATNAVPAGGVWHYVAPPNPGQGSRFYRARVE
jgi:hypothetical protein